MSNTITEYSIDLTCLSVLFLFIFSIWFAITSKATICAKKGGCAEGGRDVLHDLGKGHGLIYTRNGEREVLHHSAHHAILVRCFKKKEKIDDTCELESDALRAYGRRKGVMQTLIDHFLDGARRVNLHRKEVFKAVYFCCFFGELLSECI